MKITIKGNPLETHGTELICAAGFPFRTSDRPAPGTVELQIFGSNQESRLA